MNLMTFSRQAGNPLSILSLVLQTVLSCTLPFFVLATLDTPRGFSENAWALGLSATVSAAAALLVALLLPTAVNEGRWVWTIPTGFCVLMTISTLFLVPDGLRSGDMHGLFWPTTGEGAWPFALVTVPAWESICYSAVMVLRSRFRDRRSIDGATSTSIDGVKDLWHRLKRFK